MNIHYKKRLKPFALNLKTKKIEADDFVPGENGVWLSSMDIIEKQDSQELWFTYGTWDDKINGMNTVIERIDSKNKKLPSLTILSSKQRHYDYQISGHFNENGDCVLACEDSDFDDVCNADDNCLQEINPNQDDIFSGHLVWIYTKIQCFLHLFKRCSI